MHFSQNISESLRFTGLTLFNPYSRWLILILLNLPWLALTYITDWTKIIDGTAIRWVLVPWALVLPCVVAGIICSLLLSGYTVRLLRSGNNPPEFNDLAMLALDGIQMVLIIMVWLMPIILLVLLQFLVLTKAMIGFSIGSLFLVTVLMFIEFVLLVIAVLFGIIGVIRFTRTGRVREAFALSAIASTISRIGWLYYIFTLVFLVVIGFIFTIVTLPLAPISYAGTIIVTCLGPVLTVFRCRFISNVYDISVTTEAQQPSLVTESSGVLPAPVSPSPAGDLFKWGIVLIIILALCLIPIFWMISPFISGLPAITMAELEQTKSDDISIRSAEGYFSDPVFSRDGSHILYLATTRPDTIPVSGKSTRSGWEEDIWTMNRDGTGQTRITRIGDIYHISIDPATDSLAFSRYENGSTSVFILNDPARNPVRLSGPLPYMYFSSWSPDGRRIAATGFNLSDYNGYSVMLGNQRAPATGTEWSRLFVMNADGSSPRELARVSVAEYGLDTETSWSPDGARLVAPLFESGAVPLAVIDTTTGSTREIARSTIRTTQGFSLREDPYPRWSPKGDRIAFLRNGDVWMVKPDSTGEQKLAGDGTVEALAWSPDGSRLAFSADSYLGIIDADGTNLNRVSNIQPGPLSWSPDGKTLVYAPGVGSRIRIMSLTPGVLKMGEYMVRQMDRFAESRNASQT